MNEEREFVVQYLAKQYGRYVYTNNKNTILKFVFSNFEITIAVV